MIIGISGKMQSGKNTVVSIIQYLTHEYEIHGQITQSFDDFIKLKYDNSAFKWKQVAFAAKLKQIVPILTGIPTKDLEKQEVKDRVLGEEWWYYKNTEFNKVINLLEFETLSDNKKEYFNLVKPTVREKMVEIADDIRAKNPNAFVNALFADYGNYKGEIENYPNWIITDVRFPNELKAIENRGGITIRVNRKKINTVSPIGTPIEVDREISSLNNNHPSETALDDGTFDYVINNNGTIEELILKVKEILIKEKIIQ